jgi:hypothetical protein
MSDVIEPAATGRAKCRRCGGKIDKGVLRFGESVPNAFGEGEAMHWFHVPCAAESRPEKLDQALRSTAVELPDREAIERALKDGVENPKLVMIKHADRAPTGRATCQHCREKIEKGTLRVAIERETEATAMNAVSFVHARCVREYVGATGLVDKLRRTSPELSKDDLEELTQTIESGA